MTDTTPAALTPRQATALLRAMPIFLRAEFEAAPGEFLRWRPAPEEWCVLEVVGHLIETEERGFAGRIRTILAEERPRFSTWDPSAVARERQDEQRDPAQLLAEFSGRRTAGAALVEPLTAADLARGGDHPEVGFLTVNDLLHEWIHQRCQPSAPDAGQRPGLHLATDGQRPALQRSGLECRRDRMTTALAFSA